MKLSICIPTYNRAGCLAELLDSIAKQENAEVEIVVSDDASPDNSVAIATDYLDRLPNLRIIAQPTNIGLDRNFLAVVGNARGEYIWLMGDDDRLEPGAIQTVLEALHNWPDVAGMTLGVIDYDPRFESVTGIRQTPATQLLTGKAEVFSKISDLLGFMSALVIRRDLWQNVCEAEPIEQFMNYYIQVFIIGKALERSPNWGVVNKICVGYRSDNDQFLSKFGWMKRLRMDVIAYDELGRAILGDDNVARKAMQERIFSTHILARIINAKSGPAQAADIWPATCLLFNFYKAQAALWYFAIPLLLTPKILLKMLRCLYQNFAPMSGRQRAKDIKLSS